MKNYHFENMDEESKNWLDEIIKANAERFRDKQLEQVQFLNNVESGMYDQLFHQLGINQYDMNVDKLLEQRTHIEGGVLKKEQQESVEGYRSRRRY